MGYTLQAMQFFFLVLFFIRCLLPQRSASTSTKAWSRAARTAFQRDARRRHSRCKGDSTVEVLPAPLDPHMGLINPQALELRRVALRPPVTVCLTLRRIAFRVERRLTLGEARVTAAPASRKV